MNLLERLRIGDRRILWLMDQLEEALLECAYAEFGRTRIGELASELQLHDEIERRILIPELARRGRLRGRLQRMARKQHGLEVLLAEFDQKVASPAECSPSGVALEWMRLTNALRSHILGEDADLLVLAQKRISPPDLERLGRRVERLLH